MIMILTLLEIFFSRVYLFVIPDTNRDGIVQAYKQIIMHVPFGVQSIFRHLSHMRLAGSVHMHFDKRVRKPENVALDQRPGA